MTVEQNVLQQHSQKVTRAHRPNTQTQFGSVRQGSFGVKGGLWWGVESPSGSV